jgi:hypothetical protein
MSHSGEEVQDRELECRQQFIAKRSLCSLAILPNMCRILSAANYQQKGFGLSLWLPDDWNVVLEKARFLVSSLDDRAAPQMTAWSNVGTIDAAPARAVDIDGKAVAVP